MSESNNASLDLRMIVEENSSQKSIISRAVMAESDDTGSDLRTKATQKKIQHLTIIGMPMVELQDIGLSVRCVGSKEMKIHNNQPTAGGHLHCINYWPGGHA